MDKADGKEVYMTPSDKVRKAAEEWFSRFKVVGDAADYTAAENELVSIISRHCHVTEMEAVVERARKSLADLNGYLNEVAGKLPVAELYMVMSKISNSAATLSAIDALKGDKR